MEPYKEMYLKMMRASEAAVQLLIKCQQECEELYISAPETEVTLFPLEQVTELEATDSPAESQPSP